MKNPTYKDFLKDAVTAFAMSFWLKAAIQALDKRDPVDALHDVEHLLTVCKARLEGAF